MKKSREVKPCSQAISGMISRSASGVTQAIRFMLGASIATDFEVRRGAEKVGGLSYKSPRITAKALSYFDIRLPISRAITDMEQYIKHPIPFMAFLADLSTSSRKDAEEGLSGPM